MTLSANLTLASEKRRNNSRLLDIVPAFSSLSIVAVMLCLLAMLQCLDGNVIFLNAGRSLDVLVLQKQGGLIELQPLTYIISMPLVISKADTVIKGSGRGKTVIKPVAGFTGPYLMLLTGYRSQLVDVTIDASELSDASGLQHVVWIGGGTWIAKVLDVEIIGGPGNGLYLCGGKDMYNSLTRLDSVSVKGVKGHGIHVCTYSQDGYFSNVNATNNGLTGIYLEWAYGTRLENCRFFGNAQHGILQIGGGGSLLINTETAFNGGHGVLLSGVELSLLMNCSISDNSHGQVTLIAFNGKASKHNSFVANTMRKDGKATAIYYCPTCQANELY